MFQRALATPALELRDSACHGHPFCVTLPSNMFAPDGCSRASSRFTFRLRVQNKLTVWSLSILEGMPVLILLNRSIAFLDLVLKAASFLYPNDQALPRRLTI
jgi:hypothetical protein